MIKPFFSPLASWTTLFLIVVLVTGYLVHTQHMNADLLRTDPDLIPTNPQLMRYARTPGRSTYRSSCLGCHGENGVGDSERGIPALADADWLYGTGLVSDIEKSVTYGIRSDNPKAWNLASMPAFAHPHPSRTNAAIPPLSPDQIRDVIEFLVQARHRPADAAAARRGAQIYQSVGACYDCHSPDAQGDNAIGAPNLTDHVTLYGNGDRDSLYDSIANGRQGICPSWINVLSPLSIREVALYIYELSHFPHRGGRPS